MKNFETYFSKDLQDEINYLKKGGEPIAYTHVFAILEARFGWKQGYNERKAWENLKMPTEGKI